MQKKSPQNKPMASAVMLTIGNDGYAWVGHAMKLDVWEKVPISSKATRGTDTWNAQAFTACLAAYRRLQRRLPAVDLTLSNAPPAAGTRLPLGDIVDSSMSCLRKLVPELLPPVVSGPKEGKP